MDYGVDVSRYQAEPIDWRAAYGNGIRFVYAKATEATGHIDPTFGQKITGARGAGIVAGGYHFARPNDPAQEAEHFIKIAHSSGALGPGSLWPVLDVEDPGVGDPYIAGWIAALRHRAGVAGTIVYANLDFFRNRLNPDQWADDNVALCIARYNGDPGNPGWAHPKLAMHQHTSKGSVPGFQGQVDRNVIFGEGYNLARLTIAAGAAPPPPPPPAPVDGTHTVQPGDTLSELAKRFGTTVEALVAANRIPDPDRIQVGQVLTIPVSAGNQYTVTSGDTLSGIGAKLGRDWRELARINGISDPNMIYVGQVIKY